MKKYNNTKARIIRKKRKQMRMSHREYNIYSVRKILKDLFNKQKYFKNINPEADILKHYNL